MTNIITISVTDRDIDWLKNHKHNIQHRPSALLRQIISEIRETEENYGLSLNKNDVVKSNLAKALERQERLLKRMQDILTPEQYDKFLTDI